MVESQLRADDEGEVVACCVLARGGQAEAVQGVGGVDGKEAFLLVGGWRMDLKGQT